MELKGIQKNVSLMIKKNAKRIGSIYDEKEPTK